MALQDLVVSTPKKVVSGFQFTEGPVFNRNGYLLFSDIPANRIMRWQAGAVTPFRENSNGANGLTFDHQGRLLVCEKDRVTRTEKDGSITVLAGSLKGPNDVVYAIDGSVYFTVMGDQPAVYQVTRAGQARVVTRECAKPNGVALAPNQQKLFIADSGQRNVRVFDIDDDGSLKKGRVFSELSGAPDGLKTDESGNVWVAGPGGIWVFDREGKHLGTIATPEAPSNCAWGSGFRNLYVTARTSVYSIETKVNGTRTY